MQICMVTALDPSKTGIPKYTEGIVRGFSLSNLPLKLHLLVNKNAQQPGWSSDSVKVIRCWEGKTYPFQIISYILKIRPNIVHVQHEFFLFGGFIEAAIFPLLMFLTRICGFPIVLTLHGVPVLDHMNADFADLFFVNRLTSSARFLLRPFLKVICSLSSATTVHTEFAKSILFNYYGVDKRKTHVVPHGVDEFCCSGKAKKALKRDFIEVLFFGFITPTKGIEDLIRAFMLILNPNLRLTIVGGRHRRDNNYFSNVLKLAANDARITAVGYIPDRLVSEYFEKSDFLALPHRYQISSSGALAMAFAYEKPVIVTDTEYFSEIIKDGYNGIVVKVGDIKGLKDAIEVLAQDKSLLSRLRWGCRETKQAFSWTKLSFKFWSIYKNVFENESLFEEQSNKIKRFYPSIKKHSALYLTIKNFLNTLKALMFHLRPRSISLILKDILFRDQFTILKFRDGAELKIHLTRDDFRAISESILTEEYGKPQPGDNVIDIGAYIGDFAVFAGWNGAKVWAYEPMPESFDLAKFNVAQNNLCSQVTLVNVAVKGKRNEGESIVKLYYDPKHAYLASSFNRLGSSREISFPYTTLEEIFEKNKISRCDLLKLDCEGCEHEILIDCPDSVLEKIKAIALEYHLFCGYKLQEIVSRLASKNFFVKIKPYPSRSKDEGGGMLYAYRR